MQLKKLFDNRVTAVVAGAAVIAVVGASAGYAAGQIGSADIRDDSIRSIDVKDGTLQKRDLSDQTVRQLQGSGTAQYAGPDWSIIDRNVIGNGDSYLRAGPGSPPVGVGSLGMRTGSSQDKAAFGTEGIAGLNAPLSALTTVKYSVYTTKEDLATNADNAPSLQFEVDPTGPPANGPAPNYSTLVYQPTGLQQNAWSEQDATTAKRWWLTGQAGVASNCNQANYCTLDEVKAAYPNATLGSIQFSKGRDYAFSGAVDKLVLNNRVVDFEPLGVTVTKQ